MSSWRAIQRATLLIPSGPAHDLDRKHLHIVLNDPFPDSTGKVQVLVVCINSVPSSNIYDPSCTLFPGEHPFVVAHSFVAYRHLALVDPLHLQAEIAARQFIAKQFLDEKTFRFVIDGLKDSPYVEPRYLKYFGSLPVPVVHHPTKAAQLATERAPLSAAPDAETPTAP